MDIIQLPLGSQPSLVNWGFGSHGLRGWEEYRLPELWCLHLYAYRLELEVAQSTFEVVPGSITVTPPGCRMLYKFGVGRYRHFYIHFRTGNRKSAVAMPMFMHLPEASDELLDRLLNVQRLLTKNRTHAEILFWGLLWDLAEAGCKILEEKTGQPSLSKAVDEVIEERLPGLLKASDVAGALGYSMAHVNRAVKRQHGMTTIQLIRKRRLERAHRLLVHSTMSIKHVAAECGVEDLQQFNKWMRNAYGQSPRKLREGNRRAEGTWALHRG
ncbi:MAG: helix-turn-helix transcriptional regulator [Terrimicrobiaceae bacterium]